MAAELLEVPAQSGAAAKGIAFGRTAGAAAVVTGGGIVVEIAGAAALPVGGIIVAVDAAGVATLCAALLLRGGGKLLDLDRTAGAAVLNGESREKKHQSASSVERLGRPGPHAAAGLLSKSWLPLDSNSFAGVRQKSFAA